MSRSCVASFRRPAPRRTNDLSADHAGPSALPDYGPAHAAAASGYVHLQAGNHTTARAALAAALDQLPRTARRARILALTDLAMVELREGKLSDVCCHATTVAELLHRTPYATGTARLRAFRAIAVRPSAPTRCAPWMTT